MKKYDELDGASEGATYYVGHQPGSLLDESHVCAGETTPETGSLRIFEYNKEVMAFLNTRPTISVLRMTKTRRRTETKQLRMSEISRRRGE